MSVTRIARCLACHFRLLIATMAALYAWPAGAQGPPVHYFHRADMPPGKIGYQRLLYNPHLAGYFQPVEVRGPQGMHISPMVDGEFAEERPSPILVGMLVGHIYQLKVTNIPLHEGAELYPTVEILNRLCPPEGLELRHPVPVELTREEIEMALDGQFVTRVIYLEDSSNPLPSADDPQHQRYIDVAPDQDPLFVADRLGRPMAILRMGSRVPGENETVGVPGIGSPPLEIFEMPSPRAASYDVGDSENPVVERYQRPIPRTEPAPRRRATPFANPYQR
jgi:hypothetical protein